MNTRLQIEIVPIKSIFQDPANARIHSDKQIEELAASLRRFGQQYPIVVGSSDRIIIKGNATHRAASELGWTEIEVVWSDLCLEEARAYGIADNKLGTSSEWDLEILAGHVRELASWNPMQDWKSIGFEKEELAPLMGNDWDNSPLKEFLEPEKSLDYPNEDKPEMGKSIKVTAEMRETINSAINIVKLQEGDAKMSEGRAIELICADWLSGSRDYVKMGEAPDEQSIEENSTNL
jgi:hypothetical protein